MNATAWKHGVLREGVTLAGVASAVAVAVTIDGGFGPGSRGAFVALAGASLLAATIVRPRNLVRAATSRPIVALGALSLLSALSAAWTVGDPAEAVRWSLVIGGYAALAVAAATVATNWRGTAALAAVVALAALGAGLLGLIGVVLRVEPLALRLAGEWQPAGPFEYPPALAIAQVSALPVLLIGMLSPRRWLAAVSASGMAIALATVLYSSNRLGAALGAGVVGISILYAPRIAATPAHRVVSAWAVGLGPSLLVALALDPTSPGSSLDAELTRAIALAGGIAAALLLWLFLGGPTGHRTARVGIGTLEDSRRARVPSPLAGAVLLVCLSGLALVGLNARERTGPGVEPTSGLLHGRVEHWGAALEAARERPLLGSGTDTYYVASLHHQGEQPVLYAHNLPLEAAAELGIIGGLVAVGLFIACAQALLRARTTPAAWLLGPAVACFLLANLVDWSWHLAGAGAIWAVALGGIVAASQPVPLRPP